MNKIAYLKKQKSNLTKTVSSKSGSDSQKRGVHFRGVRSVHLRWVAYKYLYINTYLPDFSNRDRLVNSQNLIFNNYDYLFTYKKDIHESERSEKLLRKPPLQKIGKERRYLFY